MRLTFYRTVKPEDETVEFYELRQNKVLPDKLEGWAKFMEQEILPFQISKGMVITGSFRGETDPSVYV